MLCSPQKMLNITTMFLDRWVTQRTFVCFALLEIAISLGVFFFYCVYCREIAELGWLIKSWFTYSMIMGYRCSCAVTGIIGASQRKVRITRFYFGSLAMNIPLTIIAAIPFWNCTCQCEEQHRNLNRFKSPQCKVLKHFMDHNDIHRLVPGTGLPRYPLEPRKHHRRLSPEPELPHLIPNSHSSAVALAVADTVGRAAAAASTSRSVDIASGDRNPIWSNGAVMLDLLAWRSASLEMLSRVCGFFFGSDSAGPYCGTTSRRSERCRGRRVAYNGLRRARPSGPDTDTLPRRRLANEPAHGDGGARRKRIRSTLDYFNITLGGIGWQSSSRRACQPWPAVGVYKQNSDNVNRIRKMLEKLRRGEDVMHGKPRRTDEWDWPSEIDLYLERCIHQDHCGVLEATLEYFAAWQAGFNPKPGYRFNICLIDLPAYPFSMKADVPENNYVFFQKDLLFSMNSMLDAQINEDASMDKCYAVVTLVLLALAFLDVLSLPMFIIVSKFLARRCGDFLQRERQFSIEFSSEDEDSEWRDDFSVSFQTNNDCNGDSQDPVTPKAGERTPRSWRAKRKKSAVTPKGWGSVRISQAKKQPARASVVELSGSSASVAPANPKTPPDSRTSSKEGSGQGSWWGRSAPPHSSETSGSGATLSSVPQDPNDPLYVW